jgi:uncharacterized protein (TIGR02646 family)
MKYIRKGAWPQSYRQWCKSVTGTVHEDYRQLDTGIKREVQGALIREQGALCAYTMCRICMDTSHIEHIKPEGICRSERAGADLDYGNMLACYPRDGMRREWRYGAQVKGDWWEDDGADFISPLRADCEKWFSFDLRGEIRPVRRLPAAATTIRVLALDHPTLTEDRKFVIEEFIYGPNRNAPLSIAQTRRAISNICSRNGSGDFSPFCLAIRGALGEHLRVLHRTAQRRRYSRGASLK